MDGESAGRAREGMEAVAELRCYVVVAEFEVKKRFEGHKTTQAAILRCSSSTFTTSSAISNGEV